MKANLERWKHWFKAHRGWWSQAGPDDTAGMRADLAFAERIEEAQNWTELVRVLKDAGFSRYAGLARTRKVLDP